MSTFKLSKSFIDLACILIPLAAAIKVLLIFCLPPESLVERDYIQEYLLANALLSDASVASSIDQLSKEILGLDIELFPHVTPHPPTVGLLFLPLSQIDFFWSLTMWRVTTLILILLTVREVFLLAELTATKRQIIVSLALIIFSAGMLVDLELGQINVLKIYFEILSLRLVYQNRGYLGGIAAGLAFITKLGAWPLILLYLLKRMPKPLISAGLTVLVAFTVVEILEPNFSTVQYFSQTLSTNTAIYLQGHGNISLTGVYAKAMHGFEMGEFNPDPTLAVNNTNYLVVAIGLVVLIRLIWSNQFSARLGLACLTLGTVFTPISWTNNTLPILLFALFYCLKKERLNYLQALALLLLYRIDLPLSYFQSIWNDQTPIGKHLIVHSLSLCTASILLLSLTLFKRSTTREN